MQDAGRAVQYLIVRDAGHVDDAAAVFGERRTCITAQQALNGSRNDLDGADVLIWGTCNVRDIEKDRALAIELASDCSRVRLIDMSVPNAEMCTPPEVRKSGWDYAALTAWVITANALKTVPKPPAQETELELANTIKEGSAESVAAASPSAPSTAKEQSEDSVTPLSEPHEPSPIPLDMPDSLPLEAYSNEPINAPTSPHWISPRLTPRPRLEIVHNGPEDWPTPTDFWKETKVPEMRHEWMPPALADLFCEEALTWGADPGIFAMFGIGTCAGALPNYIQIRVKKDSRWLKAARLWLVVNAYSGSMKSPILVAMARALEELQEELMAEVAHLLKKHKDDTEIYEKQRQAYISARAKGETADPPLEPDQPTRNRLILKNATGETYADRLAENGERGILLIQDELVGLVTGANQYKRGGSDIEEFLKLRDGGRHSVDRKGGVTMVKEFGAAIIGGTQPDRIRDIVRKHDMTSNGFLQRFNIYTARDANLDIERPEHMDYGRMTDIVQRLYHMQHQGPVVFSEAATEVRLAFREWAHETRSPEWMPDSLRSHLSKYNDFFAEFCLTYHAIESADQHSAYIQPEVSAQTAERVSALMRECLYPHAEAFYQENILGDGELIKDTRYLAEKILAKSVPTVDLSWIAQSWTKWRTLKPWQKKGILTMLSEGGWLRSKDPRGYIDGMSYSARVSPKLQDAFPEYATVARARLDVMEERRQEKMRGD